jgi:large subunit ribosomal protein L20
MKRAEGFYGRSKNAYKVAKTKVHKAMQYATRDRKQRKRHVRSLWIVRINAAIRPLGVNYARFIQAMRTARIELDRKVLADIALRSPEALAAIVTQIKPHVSAGH